MGAGQSSAGGSRDCGLHSGKRKSLGVLLEMKMHGPLLLQMGDLVFLCLHRVA